MQIDLMVNSFVNDFARVSTLQYTKSVGQARMNWLDIKDGHHGLSHEPDKNDDAVDKLTRINKWFAGELAYLAKRLAETPEPGTGGSLLDNTTIVWTNELGKGNSHTLQDIPFVLIGNGMGFQMGRSLNFKGAAPARLLMAWPTAWVIASTPSATRNSVRTARSISAKPGQPIASPSAQRPGRSLVE